MKRCMLILALVLCASSAFATAAGIFEFLAAGLADSDGSPLTGGTATFYDAGYAADPTHLRNIWTAAAKTGTATSIILGGTGQPPGGALVYGEGTYDVVVKDADSVTLFTVTGITAPFDTLAAASYTAADVFAKVLTLDGSGSGLDADTVDTKHASDFATALQGTKADAALPASSYTAADVFAKVLTLDGPGSGLVADTLQGWLPASFATALQGTKADAALPAASYTASDILTKLKTVDGAGSGLDADTVQGQTPLTATAVQTLTNTTIASTSIIQSMYDSGWIYVGPNSGFVSTDTLSFATGTPFLTWYHDGYKICGRGGGLEAYTSTAYVPSTGKYHFQNDHGSARWFRIMFLNFQ